MLKFFMEIPSELKNLYSHWAFHTEKKTNPQSELNPVLVKEISEFIRERMLIWERKQKGIAPLTTDPILKRFRFCNIYRELDRQTIEIHQSLIPFKNGFDLWLLNLALQRLICRPQTVADVGFLSFDPAHNLQVKQKLLNHSRPKYGTAYIFPISVIQHRGIKTREEFFCDYLPAVIPKVAKIIEKFENTTVLAALEQILPAFGFNLKFHWTEILIDVAYQFPERINLYKDFYIGPGAIPTVKRLSKNLQRTLNACVNLKLEQFPYLEFEGNKVNLSAENWEGIACEFRKYTNLKNGLGRKRIYS